MRKPSILVMMLVGASAWAQGAEKKPAPAPAAVKAAPAAPDMMKPAPELKAEYGGMIGNWKCSGKGTFGGKAITTSGTYRAEWKLDGNWVVAHYEAKAPGMPGTHKGMDLYGYDAAAKMFVSFGTDNMGGWSMSKSKGWQGDTEEWTGNGVMMGKSQDVKWSITKKGDKDITVKGSSGADSFEDHCTK